MVLISRKGDKGSLIMIYTTKLKKREHDLNLIATSLFSWQTLQLVQPSHFFKLFYVVQDVCITTDKNGKKTAGSPTKKDITDMVRKQENVPERTSSFRRNYE